MTHPERLSFILGATLLTIAAVFLQQSKKQRSAVPVNRLAEDLRRAWAGYHNR